VGAVRGSRVRPRSKTAATIAIAVFKVKKNGPLDAPGTVPGDIKIARNFKHRPVGTWS